MRAAHTWLVALGILSTVAGTPVATDAQEFTFVVPVRLSGLHPDVSEMSVSCSVHDAERRQLGASGVTRVPIVGGSYSGEIAKSVTLGPSADPARAARYSCLLHLYVGGRDIPVFDLIEGRGARPEYQLRASDFRGMVEGLLPR